MFINLGIRNKPTFWEYSSAYSFLHVKLPRTKYDIDLFLGIGKGDANKHCHASEVIDKDKKIMIEEFEAGNYDQAFFDAQIKLYVHKLEKLKQIVSTDFINVDNVTLAKKFFESTDAICESHKPMLHALYTQYLDDYFTNWLKKIISPEEAASESQILEYKSILLTTTKTSFAEQEEDLIHTIEQETDTQKRVTLVDKLTADFGFFHMEYMRDPFTREEYEAYLARRHKEHTTEGIYIPPEQKRAEIIEKQKAFFNSHKDAPEIEKFKKIVFGFQEFAYILDHSKVVTVQGIYLARPLFREAAKRLNVTLGDMLFLTLPEVVALLEKNESADLKLISQRKECRVVLLKDGKINVYEGTTAQKMAIELLPDEEIKETTQIKGIAGYPGIVRGKVTNVASIADQTKFQKGDILVTHDGTAELTIFLREASAIVTDEGGMICHATIIAREMKTPCVVGTKYGSKIFKDGDMVEVDAGKGIVRKI